MMVSPSEDGHKPPSRTASFQRMLDLEKKYKMARLHRTHMSPETESQESIETRPPIQARRRDSLTQQQGQVMLDAVRRNMPFSPLSIKIPPTKDHQEDTTLETTPKDKQKHNGDHPYEKSVTFKAPEDDEVSIASEQSSICHSPSWEGWGQQKKKKKELAEQRRKDKEQADKDIKIAKKRLANRLSKAPRPLDPQPSTDARPTAIRSASTSMLAANGKISTVASIAATKPLAPTQTFVPSWGFAVTSAGFVGGIRLHPPIVVPMKAIEPPASPKPRVDAPEKEAPKHDGEESTATARRDANVAAKKALESKTANVTVAETEVRPFVQKSHTMAVEPRFANMTPSEVPRSMTMSDAIPSGVSYPPQSSKSHTVRHAPTQQDRLQPHIAVAEDITSSQEHIADVTDPSGSNAASDNFRRGTGNYRPVAERGRRRGGSASYVQNVRDRSTERAMAGLMDEAMTPVVAKLVSTATEKEHSRSSFRTLKQRMDEGLKAKFHGSMTQPDHSSDTEQDVGSEDYFTFVSKAYNPPELGLSPRPPSLFASIRASMSLRSSSSSSTPSTIRSSTDRTRIASNPTLNPSAKEQRKALASGGQHGDASQSIAKGSSSASIPPLVSAVVNKEPQPSDTTTRPSEGSSTSSFHDDFSAPSSPASTPDTSRPQSARGHSAALGYPDTTHDGAVRYDQEKFSSGDPSKGSDDPDSGKPVNETHSSVFYTSAKGDSTFSPLASPGLRHLQDEDWSRSRMPLDIDEAESGLSRMPSSEKLHHVASAPLSPVPGFDLGVEQPRPSSSRHNAPVSSEPRSHIQSRAPLGKEVQEVAELWREKRHHRKSDKKHGSRAKNDLSGAMRPPSSRAHSDPVNESTDLDILAPLQHDSHAHSRHTSRDTGHPMHSARADRDHRPKSQSPLTLPANSSGSSSPSAAYLAEARRSAPPAPPSQTSSSSSSHSAPKSTPSGPAVTAIRPILRTSMSSPAPAITASRAPLPTLPKAPSSISAAPHFRVPAQEPELLTKPIAKMLVECCSCKFLHDMPSRVYECMAQPNAVVTDRHLGVSGAITTMVKCPWCSHNMSTQCCAGYAAVVYLKERLH